VLAWETIRCCGGCWPSAPSSLDRADHIRRVGTRLSGAPRRRWSPVRLPTGGRSTSSGSRFPLVRATPPVFEVYGFTTGAYATVSATGA
jgi:hypothetical protein